MVRRLSDPDDMGATPTHQANIQDVDTNIWGPKDGHPGEILLPVPFRIPKCITNSATEGLLNVEGRAIHESRRKEKCQDGSSGSTVPASTLAMHSPWSCTTSYMNEDNLYPAEHPFIRMLMDTDDPNETPYAATTTGFPLYKGSYQVRRGKVPLGFKPNMGDNFISFPITGLDGEVKQAEYVQTILHPNPIVIRLQDDSSKVFTKPLYAAPIFHYDGKPMYQAEHLEKLKLGAEGQDQTDRMIRRLNDPSLAAEIHRFRVMSQELA